MSKGFIYSFSKEDVGACNLSLAFTYIDELHEFEIDLC